MEISEAQIKRDRVLEKIRPSVLASPIFAIPTTSVEIINGAIIIFIRRRNIAVRMDIS